MSGGSLSPRATLPAGSTTAAAERTRRLAAVRPMGRVAVGTVRMALLPLSLTLVALLTALAVGTPVELGRRTRGALRTLDRLR